MMNGKDNWGKGQRKYRYVPQCNYKQQQSQHVQAAVAVAHRGVEALDVLRCCGGQGRACDRHYRVVPVELSRHQALQRIVQGIQPVHERPERWEVLEFNHKSAEQREKSGAHSTKNYME
jgi:hypothetical protein